MTDPKPIHEAWKRLNRVYRYLQSQKAPAEALTVVNDLAVQLFEDMFKEEAA